MKQQLTIHIVFHMVTRFTGQARNALSRYLTCSYFLKCKCSFKRFISPSCRDLSIILYLILSLSLSMYIYIYLSLSLSPPPTLGLFSPRCQTGRVLSGRRSNVTRAPTTYVPKKSSRQAAKDPSYLGYPTGIISRLGSSTSVGSHES